MFFTIIIQNYKHYIQCWLNLVAIKVSWHVPKKMDITWCICEFGKGNETAKASKAMKYSIWKPRKKRELSVRVRRHGERRVQFLAGMSLYTLTPFIPLLIHFGSSSTREKLHSFSYSSRSNILMVMIFLWEHKTKAKQMVGVAHSCSRCSPSQMLLWCYGEWRAHRPPQIRKRASGRLLAGLP